MIKEFVINTVIPWLISWMQGNPNVAPILVVLMGIQGFCRLWLKPLMSSVIAFTDWTTSTKDNEFMAKVLASKAYKVISYVIDWFISVKLPQVQVKNETAVSNSVELANAINKLPDQK